MIWMLPRMLPRARPFIAPTRLRPRRPAALLAAIRDDAPVGPHGATLEDGYRAAEVCDAMLRSSSTGAHEPVTYR